MKKINLYSAVLLSLMLSACSVRAESTVRSSTKTKETVWQYDGGDTVIPSKKKKWYLYRQMQLEILQRLQ